MRWYQSVTLEGLEPAAVAAQADVPDASAFSECAHDTEPVAGIETDLADASELEIARTPTYVIEGTLLADVPDSTELAQLVEEHRGGKADDPAKWEEHDVRLR